MRRYLNTTLVNMVTNMVTIFLSNVVLAEGSGSLCSTHQPILAKRLQCI